jgi:hypothetical protein
MNPKAPNIKGFIKIYKVNNPVRPIINWHGSSAYKLTKHSVSIINQYICMTNTFIINNSISLIIELKTTDINQHKIIPIWYHEYVYQLPKSRTFTNIQYVFAKQSKVSTQEVRQILTLIKLVINQNYFYHNNSYYEQINRLAMGTCWYFFYNISHSVT